jgi:hypothetical protein
MRLTPGTPFFDMAWTGLGTPIGRLAFAVFPDFLLCVPSAFSAPLRYLSSFFLRVLRVNHLLSLTT